MRRACLECGRPTSNGNRCPEHAIRYGYTTPHWQTVRKQRLAYDGHLCQLRRDDGCTVRATTVHLDPACNGNHALATLDNTVSACLHCHGVEDAPRASGGRGAHWQREILASAQYPRMAFGISTAKNFFVEMENGAA
jgi:hypothetical protein